MTIRFSVPYWYDLHAHFRQDETVLATVADHVRMGCMGALAMPNTKPPVGKVFEEDAIGNYMSVEKYRQQIIDASKGAFVDAIVPLYLTSDTTPSMIEKGAASGLLKACKYYPPHGTTGADFSTAFKNFTENGVFKAMEEAGVTLCVHGEEHGLAPEQYFDRGTNAEELFYQNQMPKLIDDFPSLRVVGEHLTTKVGTDFILDAPDHVKATVTPQHLIYTVGHLVQGLKYHLYCLPLVKYEEDRTALRAAVTDAGNTKFYAGTDSAPHTKKTTPCGCAAGCYTGGIAPQMYAKAFELAGIDMASDTGQAIFIKFLCTIGQEYYGLEKPTKTFELENTPEEVNAVTVGDSEIIPLPIGMEEPLEWRIVD